MNIFYLHDNPSLAAQMHNDKHVVKMILESAQMLSTAHHMAGTQLNVELYKPTHVMHPCNVWLRSASGNYLYLLTLFDALCSEYTYRYGKVHKSAHLIDALAQLPCGIPDSDGFITQPAQAMPVQYQHHCAVTAYRAYYMHEKRHLAQWTRRQQPEWWK